ncbi:MAG: polyprenol monophosphomannose synthase [Elusimicrobiota bacterium]
MTSDMELSVVLPTYNEAANVPVVVERLAEALQGVAYEVIVADDDSPDGTWRVAQELSAKHGNVRCLRRMKDRGLYPAVLDAFREARGRYLAVMDADLQHDERILPEMLRRMREGGLKLVVGSRHLEGGGFEGMPPLRRLISWAGNILVRAAVSDRSTDPMSGFFVLEREAYLDVLPGLRPKGFKILMDILGSLPPGAKVGEVAFVFRIRRQGQSKLSFRVMTQFALGLFRLLFARLASRTRPS